MYLQVCAGLANRLRALVSGICGAEELGVPLVISWPKEAGCQANFRELFVQNEVFDGITIADTTLHTVRQCLSPADWEREKVNGNTITIKSYGHFYQKDAARWLQVLRSLKPRQELAEQAIIPPAVGVHIRRKDNRVSIEQSPTSAFLKRMRAYPANTLFYLATDEPAEVYNLRKEFGPRLITRANMYDRTSLVGMQMALVDFICLSKCSEILGSAGSSFSEMAAAYGDKPLHVVSQDM